MDGDYKKASEIQLKVAKAREILHIPESTNAACYAVLRERGIDVGYPKKPVLDVEQDLAERMLLSFRELGILDQ